MKPRWVPWESYSDSLIFLCQLLQSFLNPDITVLDLPALTPYTTCDLSLPLGRSAPRLAWAKEAKWSETAFATAAPALMVLPSPKPLAPKGNLLLFIGWRDGVDVVVAGFKNARSQVVRPYRASKQLGRHRHKAHKGNIRKRGRLNAVRAADISSHNDA